jgi:hypothetical protein
MLTWADKTLIAVLTLLALTGIAWPLLSQSSATTVAQAVITVDGKVVKTVKLDGHHEMIHVTGVTGYDLVEISDKQVRIVEADCPDKLCINQGWISRSPQQIVCLPNRVAVRITNGQAMGVDTITR